MPQERSKFYPLLSLVGGVDTEEERENLPEARIQFYRRQAEAFINTPLFASGVDEFIQSKIEGGTSQLTPQYGLVGIQQDIPDIVAENRLVLANMNIP